MLDRLSIKISEFIYNGSNSELKLKFDLEDIRYGTDILINTLSVTFFSLLMSIIIGTLNETIIVMISFSLLRSFSGGYHIKSNELCIIISTLIMVLTPVITMHLIIPVYINVISIAAIIFFAPSTFKVNKARNRTKFYLFKFISVLIIVLNVLTINSSLISFVFFIQALSTVQFEK